MSETVTVQADTGRLLIQSESGERSDFLTGKQLRNIGLNGRNVVDLAKLVPGVMSGAAASGSGASTVTNITGSFTINGTRNTMHEYTVDGVTNYNLGNNTGALVSVNPDALEEVRILTSNYSAEYGRLGWRVHRAHDPLRDQRVPWIRALLPPPRQPQCQQLLQQRAHCPRPLYRYNFYGWDFGGPVPLVGKGKLFFFINQEYYDQLVPQLASMNIRVPTPAERAGDFAGSVDGSGRAIAIVDPQTGQAFPGNVIPSSRQYGPGQAILRLFPDPNTTAGGNVYNYTSQVPSAYPRRENILRMDWQIAAATRLSGRWVYNHDDQQFAYGTTTASWNWPLTGYRPQERTGERSVVHSLPQFQSDAHQRVRLRNRPRGRDHRAGRRQGDSHDDGINTPLLYPNANTPNLIPSILLGGIASVATVGNTMVFGTFDQRFVINNFLDNLTKVTGKHTLKTGFFYQRASNESNSQNRVQGDIDFSNNASNPLNTGYPFSNALLGIYSSYTQASTKILQSYFYQDISGYIQDTWKLTPRLTLDLGMRLSYYEPYHNILGPESIFNPELFDPGKATRIFRPACVGAATCAAGQAAYRALDPAVPARPPLPTRSPGIWSETGAQHGDLTNGLGQTTAGYPPGGLDSKGILSQPRLGVAWNPAGNGKTVIRGGFGSFYDRYRSDVNGNGAANPPYVFNPTLNFGYLQEIQSGESGALSPSAIFGVDRIGDWPVMYSYSIGVQREFSPTPSSTWRTWELRLVTSRAGET